MDRVKRLAKELLDKHGSLFSEDFEKNKVLLSQVAVIRSKELRNRLAGFITSEIGGMQESAAEGEVEVAPTPTT